MFALPMPGLWLIFLTTAAPTEMSPDPPPTPLFG